MPPEQKPESSANDLHTYINNYVKNSQNSPSPVQTPIQTPIQIPPNIPNEPPPIQPPKRRISWRVFGLIVFILAALAAGGAFIYSKNVKDIAKLEVTGSAEYKSYIESIDKMNEMWKETEAQMKAEGASEEDIKLAHKDFVEFFGSTILLKIQLGDTKLTGDEKTGVVLKLTELTGDDSPALDADSICRNQEEIVPLPVDLQGATLTLEGSAYIAKGDDPDLCGPSFRGIQLELVADSSINNPTVGKKYYEEQGKTVERVAAGKKFTLERIVSVTNRGLFSDGSIEYLILKDEQGQLYTVATSHLSDKVVADTASWVELMSKEINLSYSKNGKKLGMLSWDYFVDYQDKIIEENTKHISYEADKFANTEGWKTFKSSKFQYEIKYPSDWQVDIPREGVIGSESLDGPNNVSISIFTTDSNNSWGQYKRNPQISELQHTASTTVAGIPAVRGMLVSFHGEPRDYITFAVALEKPINGIYYTFYLYENDGDNEYTSLPIFNSVIKSFKP